MKPFQLSLAGTALTLILLFSVTVHNVRAAGAPPVPVPTVDPRKMIQSVNVTLDMIVIVYMRDKTTHAYTLDDLTSITVNHASAKISDIKNGMQVRDFVERDDHTLDSITVDQAEPAPAKAK